MEKTFELPYPYVHPQPFHQDLRGSSIRADIYADMTHDTDKHQQDKRVTQ